MSNKYQNSKEAEEYLNSPLAVGDYVSVKKKDISNFSNGGEVNGYIENVYEDGTCDVRISDSSSMYNDEIHKLENEKIKKDSLFIGYNPFDEYKSMPRLTLLAFSIDSILSVLGIDSCHEPYVIKNNAGENAIMNELNWNPYVTDKNGERLYYQRDFCWTTNDKQLLIESIYRGVDCGKIVVREHSYKEVEGEIKNGNNEFAFFDIVDGKQRLKALADFINDVFPDKNGKYFSDFSTLGKRFFYNKLCFTFAKLDERTTDEDVLKVFLLVNNSGKQMTQEHLEYVDGILKQL